MIQPYGYPGPPHKRCKGCGRVLSMMGDYCSSCKDKYSKGRNIGTGTSCCSCGKTHGNLPSVINKWHKCRGCGSVFCDDCGYDLEKPDFFSGERLCKKCGGRTYLW